MFKIFIIIKIFLLFSRFGTSKLVGICNQCFASNNVTCLDDTHFSICYQGSPTATVTKCPDGNVCTDDLLICRPLAEGYKPICRKDYCGECQITNGIFTCVNDTTYGYCFGAETPLESTLRSCPSGYVCNYMYREICVREETNEPSCAAVIPTDSTTDETPSTTLSNSIEETTTQMTTAEEEVTTTTDKTKLTTEVNSTSETATPTQTTQVTETTIKAEPRDANTICANIRQTGYFKTDDTTCGQYVYCYLLSGQYLGWFYYCDFYFNEATQKCQTERPANCV